MYIFNDCYVFTADGTYTYIPKGAEVSIHYTDDNLNVYVAGDEVTECILKADRQSLTKGRPLIGPFPATIRYNNKISFGTAFFPLLQGGHDHLTKYDGVFDEVGIVCCTKDIPTPSDLHRWNPKTYMESSIPGHITVQDYVIFYGKPVICSPDLLTKVDLEHPSSRYSHKQLRRLKKQLVFFKEHLPTIISNFKKIVAYGFEHPGKRLHNHNVDYQAVHSATSQLYYEKHITG